MTEQARPLPPDERAEQFPHVYPWQFPIVDQYSEVLNNTGGNDPLALLNEFQKPMPNSMSFSNMPRFVLAVAVSSQVALLGHLKHHGMIA